MSEILINDTLNVTNKIFETAFEYPLEQEILLADYDEQVFKILKTAVDFSITQKYIQNSKLTIEGFFKITIYYQPPQVRHITTISKKLPFQKQFDLSENVISPFFIHTDGDVQYINARAVNSQRIDVRGVYAVNIKIFANNTLPVATEVNSSSVCTNTHDIDYFILVGAGIRQFSVEDELAYSEDMGKILNITAQNNNMNVTAYTDKINVKGEILADIAYISTSTQTVGHLSKTFIYNQIVDMPGTVENSTTFVEFDIVNFTVTQNADSKSISCIVTALLDCKAYSKGNIIVVNDVFSKKYEYEKETANLLFDNNLTAVNRTFQLSIEDEVPNGYASTYCLANISSPVLEDNNSARARLSVTVIAQNVQNEFECFSKSQDIQLDIGEKICSENEYILNCNISNISSSVSGNIMKVQLSVTISGFIIKKQILPVLCSFTENADKPLENDNNSLILYYAQQGEKLFDIAMKYKTDVNIIAKENQIESRVVEQSKMLIIPAFGM